MGNWNQGLAEKGRKAVEHHRSILEIATMCQSQGIQLLPITPENCEAVRTLPHIHEDPFDRMIIVQAILGNMPLVTKDENIWKYPDVQKVW